MSLKVTDEEYVTLLARTGKGKSVTTQLVPKKKSKYGNVKVDFDGFVFDSKAEVSRYCELKLQLQAGHIKNLSIHDLIPITLKGEFICHYEADFIYERDGERVVEDVKGYSTDLYKLKKKLVEVLMSIHIIEIRKRK